MTQAQLLEAVGVVLAIAVAIRSTWSPCGVSMLSTLTPMSERARGHRWWVTCVWYAIGGTIGGLGLGLLVAVPAAVVGWAAPNPVGVAAVVVIVALAAYATDLRISRFRLPGHTRQVDEVWLTTYRRWIYATGFGAQIGFGFATVFMTGALYLLVTVMALTGSPAAAAAIGALFGLVRGSAIVAGIRLDSPARLRSFHRRFSELAPASIAVVLATEAATMISLAWSVGMPGVGMIAAGTPVAVFAAQHLRRRRAGSPTPLTLPIAVARVPQG